MENDKLVKASDVKEYLKRVIFGADQKIDTWVDSIPAVDAVEVRHGEWIIDETFGSFACSICGSWHAGGFDSWRSPYCPKCGAKMDGEEENREAD
jgi:hypothetical protein